MRNRKVKIFALVLAGCLSLSGLTGCGGGIKMTTDDTSSKSDSGLMGSAKKEAEKVMNQKQILPMKRIK